MAQEQDDELAPPRPPYTYFGVAESMIAGAKVLAAAKPVPAVALAMLSAHALECLLKLLKAYLSRGGADPSRNHDIRKFWQKAHEGGLRIPKTPPEWVSRLDAVHRGPDYHLRYPTTHAITTPTPEPMVSELVALAELVRVRLGSK
jgi:hypothetical protein